MRGKRKIDLILQYYQNILILLEQTAYIGPKTRELEGLPTLVPEQPHEAPDVTILQLGY